MSHKNHHVGWPDDLGFGLQSLACSLGSEMATLAPKSITFCKRPASNSAASAPLAIACCEIRVTSSGMISSICSMEATCSEGLRKASFASCT